MVHELLQYLNKIWNAYFWVISLGEEVYFAHWNIEITEGTSAVYLKVSPKHVGLSCTILSVFFSKNTSALTATVFVT